jgi:alkyldihydroxyacetonephosphate synthase
MRWYGWGQEGRQFDPAGRPHLWDYARQVLGFTAADRVDPALDPAAIRLPDSRLSPALWADLSALFPPARCSRSHMDRLVHAFGRSTRDLWRLRHGRVERAPDAVVFPVDEPELIGLLALSERHGAIVIPFGGGSNVAGCLEAPQEEQRPVITVNLRLMNKVLSIDHDSGQARVQAGILGPDLEAALGAEGLTLSHIPDSFPFSTLGGWIATRSSGMYSDGYGNAEDMAVALRMITPRGVVAGRPVPHASNGPDAQRLCIGSEGTLGIISEVTVRVRKIPAVRAFHGYLFPDFASGIAALKECRDRRCTPVLARLNDVARTQLSAAFRPQEAGLQRLKGKLGKALLRHLKGVDFNTVCLMVTAFEGDAADVAAQRRLVEAVYARHGGVGVGRGPGEAFAHGKFDFPYIRDFLLDYKVMVDVNETSTCWSQMMPLYAAAQTTFQQALGAGGRQYWLGCHVSHTYPTGASLYFSFAFRCLTDAHGRYDPWAELGHYLAVKRAALDCFADHGATLSHHHAVGYEHLPWLLEENRCGPGTVVEALKARLDPHNIMNPGKLVSVREEPRRAQVGAVG